MERGHVDRITRQSITGWAANSDQPEAVVEVSVFVQGRKVGQIPCDLSRSDLRNVRVYGAGHHGFRYEFSQPIPPEENVRITVRLTKSGQTLGNGDALLKPGTAEATLVASRPPKDEQFILPAPVDPRSLFRMFSLYETEQGVYPLLCRLDFTRTQQNHLEFSAFGDIPVASRGRVPWVPYVARDHLNDLLHSPRFQRNALIYALRAFPEKRRLLFVHIPKCAGSDLSMHLAQRFPSLEQRLMEEDWTDKDGLFQALAEFVRESLFSDSIFVRGHIPLNFYGDAELIRPADRIFTVVRDPIEIALSQVNYVLTKFQLNIDSGVMERDTSEWLKLLGLSGLPEPITPQFVTEFAPKILYNRHIVEPNSMCRWLGGGDADAVRDRLARYMVEITDTSRYNDWLSGEWGISARTRQNESIKFVSLKTLAYQELAFLRSLSPEDMKLFGWIQNALSRAQRSWITGEELLGVA